VKRSGTALILLTLLTLLAGACSGGDSDLAAFCDTHTDPELEGLDPSDPDDADKLSAAMASMEKNAPEEIKDDLKITVEGFEAAATRVEEYAEDNCTDG
jgi:hypothetical protein